jgi:hypothetical protein
MSKLTYQQRKNMPRSEFVNPSKAPGSGSYPIPDLSHGRNALARVSQFGSPAEKAVVRAKVHAKFPNIGKNEQKSAKGSGEFSKSEISQGYRKVG